MNSHLLLIVGLVSLLALAPTAKAELDLAKSDVKQASDEAPSEWQKDWAVMEGFALSIDTQGYHYPTAIAFVPDPGPGPKDPLYFVTELRGKVKVVTNDRTVHTFAEGFLRTEFYDEPPRQEAEFGLAGICLAPAQGYVFVTFAYQDGETLRNNIIRFDTTPGTFALKPKHQRAFTEIFAQYDSGPSHQIGGCQIHDGTLYAGVGDGFNSPLGTQRLDTLRGKVIRMTLDGKPVTDNPFVVDNDVRKASNYVWASGFRNPFGIEIVDDKVVVAENGVNIDRFLEVRRGKNYLWKGSDNSIAANADYVFVESVGPAQMDYYRRTSPAFPARFRHQFYLALSAEESAGIMRIPYSLEEGMIVGGVEHFVRHTQDFGDALTGLAFGPDGLYFAPILPVVDGQGAVLKIKYAPQDAHPITLADLEAAEISSADEDTVVRFMVREGCFGCHRVEGVDLFGSAKAPVLGDRAMIERIQQRVNSGEFLNSLKALNARDEAPFNRYEEARNEVIEAQGLERVRAWIKYQILEPRFDGPLSGMPNLGLREAEAEAITGLLLGKANNGDGFIDKLKERLFRNEQRRLALALGAGILIGLPVWFALSRLLRFRRK